jgi:hypothetical protein
MRKALRIRETAQGSAVVRRRMSDPELVLRDQAVIEECRAAAEAGTEWSLTKAARRYRMRKDRVRKLTEGIRPVTQVYNLTSAQLDDLAMVRHVLLDAGLWRGQRTMLPLLAARYGVPQAGVARGLVVVSKRARPDVALGADAPALLRELMALEYAPAQEEAAQ